MYPGGFLLGYFQDVPGTPQLIWEDHLRDNVESYPLTIDGLVQRTLETESK